MTYNYDIWPVGQPFDPKKGSKRRTWRPQERLLQSQPLPLLHAAEHQGPLLPWQPETVLKPSLWV